MTTQRTSLLLISDDETLSSSVTAALSGVFGIKITQENTTVGRMNGSASRIAAEHEVVIFKANPDDPEELSAIRAMSDRRAANAVLFALTDEDLPLSKVRALSRCGVDDVLPRDSIPDELVSQISNWRVRQDAMLPAIWVGERHEGRIITVAQARGGVGSTTVAVNLADQLLMPKGHFKKENSNKVAIVDLDFQFGTVGVLLDVPANEGLMQLAMDGFVPKKDYLEQCITTLDSGLGVITAPARFGPLEALTIEQVDALLDNLRSMYDYVIVDLPRALVQWLEPILKRSDELLLVTDVTVPSVNASKRLMDFFLQENPGLAIDVVVNFERKPVFQASHHREASKILQRNLEHWIPRNDRATRETLDRGKPLSVVAPRSDVAKAVRKLAFDVSKKLAKPAAQKQKA